MRIFTTLLLLVSYMTTFCQSDPRVILLDGSKANSRNSMMLSQGNNLLRIMDSPIGEAYRLIWNFPEHMEVLSVEAGDKDGFESVDGSTEIVISSPVEQSGYLSISSRTRPTYAPRKSSRNSSVNVITPQSGISAEELIQDVLIGGDCFDVENVQLIGLPQMTGTFSSGTASIGLDDGVVICTGDIGIISGPNDASDAGTDMFLTDPDPDLSLLTTGTLYDVAGIEFDFRPKTDVVQFKYAFASEEYCEFVGSEFNDRFGFFISGPGFNGGFSNGAINIAEVGGTDVAINSINSVSNGTYYVSNVPTSNGSPGPTPACDVEYATPAAAETFIQFDGYTTVLTAIANVQPCELYHIRLVIADVGDGDWDSGVFLEANSFGSDDLVESDVTYPNTDFDYLIEGCQDGSIRFTRLDADDISQDFEVNYSIDPTSTATAGVDYEAFPNPIIIPAGSHSVTIPITVFIDDIIEGSEFIYINLQNACSCEKDQVEIEIRDYEPLEITPQHLSSCEPGIQLIEVGVEGGLAPYQYEWNTGATTMHISEQISSSDTFYVTVTDECGEEDSTDVIVSYIDNESIRFDAEDLITCEGLEQPLSVPIIYSGSLPQEVTILRDGVIFEVLTLTEPVTNILISQSGTYTIDEFLVSPCLIDPTDELIIQATVLDVDAIVTDFSCALSTEGSITLHVAGGTAPYAYVWSHDMTLDTSFVNVDGGQYFVTITDQAGCSTIDTFEVMSSDDVRIEVDSIRHIDCRDPQHGYVQLIQPTRDSFQLFWQGQATDMFEFDSLNAGTYQVVIIDSIHGCIDTADIVILDLRRDIETSTLHDTITCDVDTFRAEVVHEDSVESYVYQWFDEDGQPISGADSSVIHSPHEVVIVRVENLNNGCSVLDTVQHHQPMNMPIADVGPDLLLNCAVRSVMIDLTGNVYTDDAVITLYTPIDSQRLSSSTSSVTVMAPGSYVLSIIDTFTHCSDTDTIVVTDLTNDILVDIQDDGPITCDRPSVQIMATIQGSSNPLEISWTTIDGVITSSAQSPVITVTAGGTYIISVVDSVTRCMGADTVSISSDTTHPIVSLIDMDTIECGSDRLQVNSIGSSFGVQFEYLWSTPNGTIVTDVDGTSIEVSSPGVYYLQISNTLNGCASLDSIVVVPQESFPFFEFNTPEVLNCLRDEVEVSIQAPFDEEVTYTWSTNDGMITDGHGTSMISVTAAGTYILEVVNNQTGCAFTDSIVVFEDMEVPMVVLSASGALSCVRTEVDITSDGSSTGLAYDYTWSTADGHVTSATDGANITVDSSGTYTLEIVNNENGCINSDSIVIDRLPELSAALTITQPSCIMELGEIDLDLDQTTGTAPYSYSLDGGAASEEWPLFLVPGTYTIEVQDALGCTQEFVVTLDEIEDITVSIASIFEVQVGQSIQLIPTINRDVSEIEQFSWTPPLYLDDPSLWTPTATPLEDITYTLEVLDLHGCEGSADVTLHIVDSVKVYIPNAFSPNNDGVNDRFSVFTPDQGARLTTFMIFNRWGGKVFERNGLMVNDPLASWDGTNDRDPLDMAAFAYVIEIMFSSGRTEQFNGEVYLIR